MRPANAWPLVLILAGCASAADPVEEADAGGEIPEAMAGLPQAVIAEHALFDIDSGDPERAERARRVLLALPEGPGVEILRARVRSGPAGSTARLEALAVLAERGDPLAAAAAEEVVTMCLREMARPEPSRRSRMLCMDRLRAMGEAARPLLREASRPGGPSSGEAAAALREIFDEEPDHRLREGRP